MIIQCERVRKVNLWRSVTVTRFTPPQVASGYEFIYYTFADNKKASLKIRPKKS